MFALSILSGILVGLNTCTSTLAAPGSIRSSGIQEDLLCFAAYPQAESYCSKYFLLPQTTVYVTQTVLIGKRQATAAVQKRAISTVAATPTCTPPNPVFGGGESFVPIETATGFSRNYTQLDVGLPRLPLLSYLNIADCSTAAGDCAAVADGAQFNAFDIYQLNSTQSWLCVAYPGFHGGQEGFNVSNPDVYEAVAYTIT